MPEWKHDGNTVDNERGAGASGPCRVWAEPTNAPAGLTLRPLTIEDVPALLALQEQVLAVLEDRDYTKDEAKKEIQAYLTGERRGI